MQDFYGGRVIAYRPIFKTITKSATAGLLLSQLFWLGREGKPFTRTYAELEEDLDIQQRTLQRARDLLLERDFLIKQPPTREMVFVLNFLAIHDSIHAHIKKLKAAEKSVRKTDLSFLKTLATRFNFAHEEALGSGQNTHNSIDKTSTHSGQNVHTDSGQNVHDSVDKMSTDGGQNVHPLYNKNNKSSRETAAAAAGLSFEELKQRVENASAFKELEILIGADKLGRLMVEFTNKNDSYPGLRQMKKWIQVELENEQAGNPEEFMPKAPAKPKPASQGIPKMPEAFIKWTKRNYPSKKPKVMWKNEFCREEFEEEQKNENK